MEHSQRDSTGTPAMSSAAVESRPSVDSQRSVRSATLSPDSPYHHHLGQFGTSHTSPPTGLTLSRSSSRSSTHKNTHSPSPIRPPKNDRRRSSAASSVISAMATPDMPTPNTSPPLKLVESISPPYLHVNTTVSPGLHSIKAGSTPVSPALRADNNSLQSPEMLLQSSSSSSLGLDSYYLNTGIGSSPQKAKQQAPNSEVSGNTALENLLAREDSYTNMPIPSPGASASSNASTSNSPWLAPTTASPFASTSALPRSPSATREGPDGRTISLTRGTSLSPSKSAGPVAAFTAGASHIPFSMSGTPLKITSTTGLPSTTIRKPRSPTTSRFSRKKREASGGISSEEVYSNSSSKSDAGSASDAGGSDIGSRFGSFRRTRSRSNSQSSSKRGISSADVFGSPTLSGGENSGREGSSSLANVLRGLRRVNSKGVEEKDSDREGRVRGHSRTSSAASRHSRNEAVPPLPPFPAEHLDEHLARVRHSSTPSSQISASDAESYLSDAPSHRSQSRLRNPRLSSLPIRSRTSSNDSIHERRAKDIVSDAAAQVPRSALMDRQSSNLTVSSSAYTAEEAVSGEGDGTLMVDETLPLSSTRSTRSGAARSESSAYSSASDAEDVPFQSRFMPSYIPQDVNPDEEYGEDDALDAARRSALLAESRRRSTLVPVDRAEARSSAQDGEVSSSSSIPDSKAKSRSRASSSAASEGSASVRRRAPPPSHQPYMAALSPKGSLKRKTSSGSRRSLSKARNSLDYGKGGDHAALKSPAAGTEADNEAEGDSLVGEMLGRRRSTIRPGQIALPPSGFDHSPKVSPRSPAPTSLAGSGSPNGTQDRVPSSPTKPTKSRARRSSSGSLRTFSPPPRASSRPSTPQSPAKASSPGLTPYTTSTSPLKHRKGSLAESARKDESDSASGIEQKYTPRERGASLGSESMRSRHTREAAASSATDTILSLPYTESGAQTSVENVLGSGRSTADSDILDELNAAIGEAMNHASPDIPKSAVLGSVEMTKADSDLPPLPANRFSARPSVVHHRRSSSDVLSSVSPTKPAYPGHHRRTSSTEIGGFSSPLRIDRQLSGTKGSLSPTRVSGNITTQVDGRQSSLSGMSSFSETATPYGMTSPGTAKQFLPSHAETHMALDLDRIMQAQLQRNKPLPQAVKLREELRSTRNAGERAIMYARKINELSVCATGLDLWIWRMRSAPAAAPPLTRDQRFGSVASAMPTVSDATGTMRSYSPSVFANLNQFGALQQQNNPASGHATRNDNMSESPFPLRSGSQDVYRARDITQRAPSLAPSTMVPHNIPYPGVYTSTSSLSTLPTIQNYASSVHSNGTSGPGASRAGGAAASFASAALNAAGLPSRVGFFGLGRKSSKRSAGPIGARGRQGAGDNGHQVYSNLSISAPIQAPPQDLSPSTVRTTNVLRPSGPRPSVSSNSSDRDNLLFSPPLNATYPSMSSLPAIPQHSSPVPSATLPAMSSRPSAASLSFEGAAQVGNDELVATMQDILPHASKAELTKYLIACDNDHLAAIGAYLDDERRGALS